MKCTAKARRRIPIGTETTKFLKYLMGGGLLFGLIFLIVAPIFVFSTLNPMVNLNNPTKASLSLTLNYGQTKHMEILSMSDALINDVKDNSNDLTTLRNNQALRAAEISQFQEVTFGNSPDHNDFPTDEKIKGAYDILLNQNHPIGVILTYTFVRPVLFSLILRNLQESSKLYSKLPMKILKIREKNFYVFSTIVYQVWN